jgi:hypothetical protein
MLLLHMWVRSCPPRMDGASLFLERGVLGVIRERLFTRSIEIGDTVSVLRFFDHGSFSSSLTFDGLSSTQHVGCSLPYVLIVFPKVGTNNESL